VVGDVDGVEGDPTGVDAADDSRFPRTLLDRVHVPVGAVLRDLVADPDKAQKLGVAARAYVRANFVGDLHLLRYAALFETLLDSRSSG
jgi:hypothetical protein